MEKQINEDPFITIKEACSLLRCSSVTVWKLTKTGQLSYYRIGRRKLFLKSQILSECLVPKKNNNEDEQAQAVADA